MRRFVILIEQFARRAIVYPLLRIFFRNTIQEDQIDLSSVRKLLILRYDHIGDMIVTTPIFRNLKKLYPHLQIGVVTSELNAGLIRFDHNVDDIYILYSNWIRLIQEIWRARKTKYDVVLNFIFNRTTTGGILANVISPHSIKIGQGDEKYRFYFNRLLKLNRSNGHMINTLALIIQHAFGIILEDKDLEFEINTDQYSRQKVDEFLKQKETKRKGSYNSKAKTYIVFNLSATNKSKKISLNQAKSLGLHLGMNPSFKTILTFAPTDLEMRETAMSLLASEKCLIYPDAGNATLLELASLIEGALCVITPDTSIIHFASAAKTPVLGFYSPIEEMHEWLPFRVNHNLVIAGEGKPVSSIPIDIMIYETDLFISSLFKE